MKKYASSKGFKLIENGRFNIDYPRGYNLLTGFVETADYSKNRVFLPDFRELRNNG